MSDLNLDGEAFLRAFVTVLVIMDPIGSVPIFLSLTRGRNAVERKRSAWQAATVAACVIIVFALFGERILAALGISLEALQVAGGLLLLVIALELLRGDDKERAVEETGRNVALVPLGTPLLAGPGAIATTMLYMRQATGADGDLVVIGALVSALVVVWLSLRSAVFIGRVIKENGIHLLSRIMGLLVAAIGTQLVAEAIEQWVRHGVS